MKIIAKKKNDFFFAIINSQFIPFIFLNFELNPYLVFIYKKLNFLMSL